MVAGRDAIRMLAAQLASPVLIPDEEVPSEHWDTWMELMELDDLIGGWLTTATDGNVDRRAVHVALQTLIEHPEWRSVISERYDLLIDAAKALMTI